MERVEFLTGGLRCVGHWHWPEPEGERLPVIFMGHGFGTHWDFGTLETIADFTAAGFAVFTFDYRHFGESAGEPRQLLHVGRQLEDWRQGLAVVRGDHRIDPNRVAIWGSSLGGGHALSVAARDPGIAAAVVQVPHCSGLAALANVPITTSLRVTGHMVLDLACAGVGKLHLIPMFGEPGELAALSFPGWKEQALGLVPGGCESWRNAFPARSMATVVNYNPARVATKIRCPVHIQYALEDVGVPPDSVRKAAAKIPRVELHGFEGDHFDMYSGERRIAVVQGQLEFLHRWL